MQNLKIKNIIYLLAFVILCGCSKNEEGFNNNENNSISNEISQPEFGGMIGLGPQLTNPYSV